MKATRKPGKASADDLRPEYHFDYARSRANRFASTQGRTVAVVIDPDVAQVFDSSESVNRLLRSVIAAVPGAKAGHRDGPRKAG
jgi:hypothetical protein